MKATELATFVGRVRSFFGGEMDEKIFDLAKVRIANLRADVCTDALAQYALQYGGARGRFLPSKFFEYYTTHLARVGRMSPAPELDAKSLAEDAVRSEWRHLRDEAVQIPSTEVEAIMTLLTTNCRWVRPKGGVDTWTRGWLLAVTDIAHHREVDTYNPATGRYNRRVTAIQFYTTMVLPQGRSEEVDDLLAKI